MSDRDAHAIATWVQQLQADAYDEQEKENAMRPCEACIGHGHWVAYPSTKRMCASCQGTGLIPSGEWPERYAALIAEARARGVAEGWEEQVWIGHVEDGTSRKAWMPMQATDWRDDPEQLALFEAEMVRRGLLAPEKIAR